MRGLAGILVIALVVQVRSDSSDEEKLCVKERRRALVSIKKQMDSCRESLVTSDTDGQEIQPSDGCLIKCALNRMKALEPPGTVTEKSFMEALEKRATGKRRERALEIFKGCEEHTKEIDPADKEKCPGYEAFGTCVQKGIEDICVEAISSAPNKDEL